MTADLPRWAMGDPARIVERLEEAEKRRHARSKQGKAERARIGIERLFTGKDMGRKLEIAPHITMALHQWGEWANRPQFWENLDATPYWKLLDIGSTGRSPDIRLDPQSMKIHKAFLRMTCRVTQAVLAGYYVANCNWDDKRTLFEERGISRSEFYAVLRRGSIALFNAAKL